MKKHTLIITIFSCFQLFSQNNESNIKLFLNCNYCDETYIKQNLTFVEFVRDQNYADAIVLFRTQQNGSGGTSYEIEFTGQNSYSEINEKLIFSTNADNTENEIRDLIFKNIKLGLVRYWVKNGKQDKISIQLEKIEPNTKEEEKDPWNKWVFNLGVNGYFYGQETSKDNSISFSTTIKQVTEKNKFYLRGSLNNSKSVFTYDGNDIISKQKSTNLTMYNVVSINKHWSAGIFATAGESTFRNYDFYTSLKPAVEYNLFSYDDSSKKQLTLSYKVGALQNNYVEKTIFNKEKEFLWEHNFMLGGSVNQNWGNITSEVSYQSFLQDTSLHQFSFYLGTSFRIFKGLSLNVNANYEITNNQINLAGGNLSLEELLLRQQQVKSGYNYFISTGLNYSFGSIYNTIVNPRFNF
ncbi:hypothetical protein [Lutibacter sp.]|uniref:hypothetical protein n=1 Tax=Lutibacter sp. TaxID=1925666 RepID=UPI002735F523|nr:hypothetical protein [Lutibacter sp.]MDP3314354.1 hypothetical protein [Lutibacter sp.]